MQMDKLSNKKSTLSSHRIKGNKRATTRKISRHTIAIVSWSRARAIRIASQIVEVAIETMEELARPMVEQSSSMMMSIYPVNQMMKKSDLTASMISLEMGKRQISKTVKRVQARTNRAGSKIKLQFQKQKMILCLRQNDEEMIHQETGISRTSTGWTRSEGIVGKMFV